VGYPITFCWTVPRTVSTSFERMIIERGDHAVFDEPFSRSYYFGPEQRSDRFPVRRDEHSVAAVIAEIAAAAEQRPVFAKDMAYQAIDLVDHEVLAVWQHCFLIRHPAATLRSLAGVWPDFTDDETGWSALDRMADLVEAAGHPLVVVESEQLCADPVAVVTAWCRAMGWVFDRAALTWEPGMQPEWELWPEWHASSSAATGFRPLPDEVELSPDAPARWRDALAEALPVHTRLAAHRVHAPTPSKSF
jgi:hypothetical protein